MATANSSLMASNSSMNMTALLTQSPITLSPEALIVIGIAQVLFQAFIFALLIIYKTELYLTTKVRKKITDFDYDFSDEKSA